VLSAYGRRPDHSIACLLNLLCALCALCVERDTIQLGSEHPPEEAPIVANLWQAGEMILHM